MFPAKHGETGFAHCINCNASIAYVRYSYRQKQWKNQLSYPSLDVISDFAKKRDDLQVAVVLFIHRNGRGEQL
jgi:hypothetical protein